MSGDPKELATSDQPTVELRPTVDDPVPLHTSVVLAALQPDNAPTFRDEAEEETTGLEPTDPAVGLRAALGQRFVAEAEVGRGGMGVVVRAWDTELRRRVALKWLRDDKASSRRQLMRFLAEAQLTAQLDHPGIVPVHDIGVSQDGRLFYVMKLVEGRTMRELVAEHHAGAPESWSRRRLLTALLRALDAVDYAHHRGVIHRDLKPANLVLGSYGEVWVVDWGIAHVKDKNEVDVPPSRARPDPTSPGTAMGTPGYASPEQLAGDRIDTRADIWSLGAVLHELLTGRPPFDDVPSGKRLARALEGPCDPRKAPGGRDTPDGLAKIVINATQPDPDKRYRTVRVMAEALEHWLDREQQREQDLAGWVKRQLDLAVLTVEGRSVRVADALAHLAASTELLLADPPEAKAVDRWLAEAGFEVDADGFFQPRGLAASVRDKSAAPDALSWSWPPSRAQDPVARAHLYALRRLGPVLRRLAEQLPEVSFWYFVDARNVAMVFPADDMAAAIPSEFDFLAYPAFQVATPDANPDRALRATPPHVDYGNKGLITAMTLPVYVDGAFVGVWAADVPLAVLHQDVQLAEDDRELVFIVDADGRVVAHPSDRTAPAAEKGAVLTRTLADLGSPLSGLDVAGMIAKRQGTLRLPRADGREVVVRFEVAARLGWVVCHVTKG